MRLVRLKIEFKILPVLFHSARIIHRDQTGKASAAAKRKTLWLMLCDLLHWSVEQWQRKTFLPLSVVSQQAGSDSIDSPFLTIRSFSASSSTRSSNSWK